MKLTYDEHTDTFFLECSYHARRVAKEHRFKWNPDKFLWFTQDVHGAMNFYLEADSSARRAMSRKLALEDSRKVKKEG